MSILPSGPQITPDPPPPVAIRAIDWEPVAFGVDQQPASQLPLTFEWSRDLDWWVGYRQTSGFKYTARPPWRPW